MWLIKGVVNKVVFLSGDWFFDYDLYIPVLEVQKTNYFFRQILILDNSIQFGMEALFPPIPNQRIDQFNWSSFGVRMISAM